MLVVDLEVAMSGYLNLPTMPGHSLVQILMEKLLVMNLGGRLHCQVMALL